MPFAKKVSITNYNNTILAYYSCIIITEADLMRVCLKLTCLFSASHLLLSTIATLGLMKKEHTVASCNSVEEDKLILPFCVLCVLQSYQQSPLDSIDPTRVERLSTL
jgi:hypothetical protein